MFQIACPNAIPPVYADWSEEEQARFAAQVKAKVESETAQDPAGPAQPPGETMTLPEESTPVLTNDNGAQASAVA